LEILIDLLKVLVFLSLDPPLMMDIDSRHQEYDPRSE
jgi:hypothetical protein